MTSSSPNKIPSSLENDESIIDSVRSSNYNHLIEELSSFFDTNPFGRKIIKLDLDRVEKLYKKLENASIRVKRVENYHPFAFVTVMYESDIHSVTSILVAKAIGDSLNDAFPQGGYLNLAKTNIRSPQRITKPDAQLCPLARRERRGLPTVVLEVGVIETKIDLLRDVSDWFTIQEGDFVIGAAVVVKIKLGSRNGVEGPGLLSMRFTGAIFESYLRVVRADATRDGRQEGWREMVRRETIESTVVLDGDGHIALDAYPNGIKFSVLINRGGRDEQGNGYHQAITVPANLLNPNAENDDNVVLLNEDDIIKITKDVFWMHRNG